MNVKLHTLAFKGSEPVADVADSAALLHGVLELDGQLIRNGKVKITTDGGGVVMVTAEIIASSLEVVTHNKDSWESLDAP